MLTEVHRTQYCHDENDARTFETPNKTKIRVVQLKGRGETIYYCHTDFKTLHINNNVYWGHGLSWDKALKYIEEYVKLL